MRKAVKRGLWTAGALAAAVGIAALYRPRPLTVETSQVTRGALVEDVTETGQTAVRELYAVGAPAGGELARIGLKPGDRVRKGDVVATVAPLVAAPLDATARAAAEARAQAAEAGVQQASAGVTRAETAFAQAKAEKRRGLMLAREKAIAPQELETLTFREKEAAASLATAKAALDGARHEQEAARAPLVGGARGGAPLQVRAPVDATVLRVLQPSEEVVAAGTPLVELGDLADLEVVVDVLSRDAGRIRPGAPVELGGWRRRTEAVGAAGERDAEGAAPTIAPARGEVRLVEPQAFTKVSALGVEEQRVRVHVAAPAELFAREGLGAGYAVDARILTAVAEDVVKLPAGALVLDRGAWRAFVVKDGEARRVAVTVGRRGGDAVEVTGGLEPGRTVVVYPPEGLADGARVAVAP